MKLIPTGSQTIGPFFREALKRPAWSDLTREGAEGEIVRIDGAVFDGDGSPVPDALIEIWQAGPDGRYAHPEDLAPVPSDRLFRGFGRACTDVEGRFWFRTVVPGAVERPDGARQAPHVNVNVFARGLLRQLVTRIYFSDREEENRRDPVLSAIADEAVRRTLVAEQIAPQGGFTSYRFDIVLQGPNETAFFAI
ncbi:MAG TPA: protocatechuate 3,4-dioxygenase subunit alpha [Candidatus Baltobacteraceae bacterium]|nr:protocatechuate 3,4-dioxygenase subunit alpha [Candidatus Baltobacteraceae bacterium]